MADAAVEFLLQNLKQVLVYHADLIQNAKSELEKLERDLRLFKAFLKESTKTRITDERVKQLVAEIRDIVYEVEDVIDSSITQAADAKTRNYFTRFFRAPANLINVAKSVEDIGEKVQRIMNRDRFAFATSDIFRPETQTVEALKVPTVREENIVGFDEEAETIITYLKEETNQLDVISIIGLPGLGKTTLAGKIFRDEKIQYQFPTRIWVFVSQEFRKRDVFLEILSKFTNITDTLKQRTDQEIAQILRGYLEKGKFLIVMDDVWTADAWNELQVAFPKFNKTGKILITSRHEQVAHTANRKRPPYKLRFRTHAESLQLLYLEVFGEPSCPFQEDLQTSGEEIAKKCGGLPLAIVVIAGILLKPLFGDTMSRRDTWKQVSETVPLLLQQAPKVEEVIALSYNNLPYHMRPCFLYLGMFPEDFAIPVWTLIRLWIAEGFIQQNVGVTLEQTAQDYLKELVNRNLVMVDRMSTDGKIKTCRVHDTLRQFCLNESSCAREKFLEEMKKSAEGCFELGANFENYRRLCIHSNIVEFLSLEKLFGPRVRSLVCSSKEEMLELPAIKVTSISSAFKLLRILDAKPIHFTYFPRDLTQLVHLRYIVLSSNFTIIPKYVDKLWNLQSLIVYTSSDTLEIKANIWRMLQLRHVKTNTSTILPEREKSTEELCEKLQTLGTISPKSFKEEVFDRLRSLRKLGIRGCLVGLVDVKGLEKLDNLDKLKLVNDLHSSPSSGGRLPSLPEPYRFPPKVRSLTLCSTYLDWVHMSTLGKLDTLEVLKLKENAFVGECWEVSNGHFCHLVVLHIEHADLSVWVAEANHFPRLKRLVIKNCEKLGEIPFALSEVQSFEMLELKRAPKAAESARKIEREKRKQQEQERDTFKRIKFKLRIAPGDE